MFADYVFDTYIAEGCTFNSDLWAHAPDGTQCTTNGAERFHRNYNDNFISPHPNIYKVIDTLVSLQAETDAKLRAIQKNKHNYVRRETRRKLEYYNEIWLRYDRGDMPIDTYIKQMGSYFKYNKGTIKN